MPPLGIPSRIFQYAFSFRKLESLVYIFVADSMGLSSIFIRLAVVASQIREVAQNSVKIWTYRSSRSSKVINYGTNRKRICDFLLVINSNFGPILHRFWDTATNLLKIAYFSYPSLIRCPRSLCSLYKFNWTNFQEISRRLQEGFQEKSRTC